MDTPALSGLARRIVQDQLLDATVASNASKQATQDKIPFITYLVQSKLADARDLAMVCAEEFGYPFFDLAALDKVRTATALFQPNLAILMTALGCSLSRPWTITLALTCLSFL